MTSLRKLICLILFTITITALFLPQAVAANLNTASVLVVHKDRQTGTILRQDTYIVEAGYYGPYNPLNFSGYASGSLAAGSPPGFGVVSAGQTVVVTYLYSKCVTSASIHVQHKDRETGAILRQDTYTVDPGIYGPYNTMNFSGYASGSLAAGSAPGFGTINAGQTISIIYLYSKCPTTATIQVVHKDQETGETLKQDTYTVNPGAYGPYNAQTFTGYGAGVLAPGSAPASGTINAGQTITITYLYKKGTGKATIHVVHKDGDTGTILSQDTYVVSPGPYGSYDAWLFVGYGFGVLAEYSAPPSGTINDGETITITYLYRKGSGQANIHVVHKDRETGEILKEDIYNVDPGKYGPYNALTFDNYGPGTLASNSAPPSGTINAEQTIVITYLYSKTPGEANIHVVHQDRESGTILKEDTYTVIPGPYGPYNAMTFSGYGSGSLAAGSAPASGTISANETITITYLYSKTPMTANIHVVHKDRETGEILKEDTYSVDPGVYGPYNAMTFNGYGSGALAAGSALASGTISAGQTITITYLYSKCPTTATIKVFHKDRDTGAILWQDTLTVPAGSYGPYNTYPFPGYEPGSLAAGSDPASGTINGGETKTITFLYSKSNGCPTTATIKVYHKDKDTGTILWEDTLTISAGAYGPYNTYPFPGYGPGSLAAGSAPASGTISGGETKTITFLYSKSGGC